MQAFLQKVRGRHRALPCGVVRPRYAGLGVHKKRGLADAEILQHFKVGFVADSLKARLTTAQRAVWNGEGVADNGRLFWHWKFLRFFKTTTPVNGLSILETQPKFHVGLMEICLGDFGMPYLVAELLDSGLDSLACALPIPLGGYFL